MGAKQLSAGRNLLRVLILFPIATLFLSFTAQLPAATYGKQKLARALLVGLLRDLSEVKEQGLELLQNLTCNHEVLVHLLVGGKLHEIAGSTSINDIRSWNGSYAGSRGRGLTPSNSCAPIWIDRQSDLLRQNESIHPRRINRIAQLRDRQRRRIQELYFTVKSQHDGWYLDDSSIIILVDLDLVLFPTARDIMVRAEKLSSISHADNNASHVICAAGNNLIASQRSNKLAYYDLFATILYPNTFAVSLNSRLFREKLDDENPNLIPPDNEGKARSRSDIYSLMDRFIQLSLLDKDQLVPVRSCFGGLGLYRAKTWLTPLCNYTIPSSVVAKYRRMRKKLRRMRKRNSGLVLSMKEKDIFQRSDYRYSAFGDQPCEHVVFHECLHREVFQTISKARDTPKEPFPRQIVVDAHFHSHWHG